MTGPVFRAGDRVELRPVESADLDAVQRLFSEPESRRHHHETTPKPEAAMESWHEEIGEEGDEMLLATTGGDRLGLVGLRRLDRTDGTAILTWLFDPQRADADAADALRETAGYAFDELRLDKLGAEVLEDDDDQAVLEQLGFVHEARFRQERYVDGEFVDVQRYGVLREEWEG